MSSAGHKWILVATDYFTRWTEVVSLKDAIENSVVQFLEGIATRFGSPSTIISDNAKAFVGSQISLWAVQHDVFLKTSSNYYPQGNGLADSSNKNLIRIIKRTLEDNQRLWHLKLGTTLWADRVIPKRSLRNSPFILVYGREARLPLSLEFPSLDLAHQLEVLENDALSVRYVELTQNEEVGEKSKQDLNVNQG
ncbi:uncharacterized protein LOC131065493 [Cryptomeria japonica]|uniref:uncharacterized protein LOC131065493 n=1 Tax=Cryptomeria japonica TaxID=3369 RepID=UPI0025AD44B2|nr:uncharacterized protein LOC131065493 [Cryptomeria japonica]